MSAVRYIFNTHGAHVAYVKNDKIFTADNRWYGFKQGNFVFLKTRKFVGYLRGDDRIVKNKNELPRPWHFPPFEPFLPSRPMLPPRRSPMTRLPSEYEDIFETAT